MNHDILVRKSILPFETLLGSGSGYRVQYRMDFKVPPKEGKALFADTSARFGEKDSSAFRVREERSSGGSFSDITTTLDDFLGSILYATMLIALSSFMVAFSRFAIERRKLIRAILWI